MFGVNGLDWDAVLGICSEVLDPLPDHIAGLSVPQGRVKISKAADNISIGFGGILVDTFNGLAELTFTLSGSDESYFDVVLGAEEIEYEFTQMGIFTRLAKGSPGSKKRCQEQLPLPAGVVHPMLLVVPVP